MTTHGPFAFTTATTAGCNDFFWTADNGNQTAEDLPATTGNRQWWWNDDNTGSGAVGPTGGEEGGTSGYIHIETSDTGDGFGDQYWMEFDTALDASAEQWQFNFFTNQRGDDNEVLVEIQINESGGGWSTVTNGTFCGPGDSFPPRVANDGSDIWEPRTVDLSDSGANNDSSTLVRILLTLPLSGTSWHNDMGIDTVEIVGTVLGGTFVQSSFRAKNDTGGETSTDWKAAIDTDWTQTVDENVRVRFLIEETADVADANVEFQLQYNKNTGGWNDVNGSSTNVRSTATGNVVDGIDTTEQLAGPGTFLTTNAGFDEVNGLAGGASLDFSASANEEVELAYCVQVRSADTVPGDTIQLRLVKEPDITLSSYAETPTITVPGAEYTQSSFRGREDDDDEVNAAWIVAADTNWSQVYDENFRVRFLIEETEDIADANVEFQLQYNLAGGGWNNVDAASTVARSSASPNVTDGIDTTEQLSGPGTFLTPNAGFDEADGISGGAALDFTASANQEVELEYCLQLRSADITDFQTVQLRVLVSTGTGSVTVYSETPTITAIPQPAWVMSSSANFADGDPTTRQLTDLGTTFTPGEMKEDDGGNAAATLLKNRFLEGEFCMQATTASVAGAQYEFRQADVTQHGEKLEVYDEIAKVTITP